MTETVKIQFYKITRCGYYRYGSDRPEFGHISDILDQLMAWVTAGNKALAETCTYELEAGEDSHRAFCFDIRKHQSTGDVVLVTWNETPTNEGRVVTVNGQQQVGDAEVSFTNLPEGSIPGYATYFWFVPDQNVFAALRFHHTLLVGRANLERYLREYCAKFTSYVVAEEENDGAEILGYAEGDGEPKNLRPNFNSCVYRKPGQVDFIRRNVRSITKVTRKNKLCPQVALHRATWQKLLEGIGISEREQTLNTDVKIRYEVPFQPTLEQFNAMVEEWEENHESKWDDIGFDLSGEKDTKWLSNSLARDEFELDVTRNNDEVVDVMSLLNSLTVQRDRILALFR